MRIVDVKVHLVPTPVVPPYRWREGLPGSEREGVGAVLRVVTDEGVEGIATTHRGKIVADLVERRLRDELIGQDPLQREWLWHRVWELDRIEEFPIYALGLVDVALWDLAGKVAGLPVYQLLGGYRTSIPAYASTVTFDSVEEYLDVADQCLALGYPAIKLHAWGDARRDAALCQALRTHVDDAVPLMYDGSAGFDLPDAVYLGHALAEAGYLWYEEPMREFSITAYRRLAEMVRIPLLVAETSDGAHMNAADFHLRAHERRFQGRHHGRPAHRPPGRRLPPARGGARRRPRAHTPVHGHPQYHLLRVAGYDQPRGARAGRGRAGAGPCADRAGHRLRGALGRHHALGKRTACRIA